MLIFISYHCSFLSLYHKNCYFFTNIFFYQVGYLFTCYFTDHLIVGPLVCDHFRATDYFIASLSPQCMHNMKGFPCQDSNSFDQARCLDNCKNGMCPEMGYNAVMQNSSRVLGKHFLYTFSSAPFCGKYVTLYGLHSNGINCN